MAGVHKTPFHVLLFFVLLLSFVYILSILEVANQNFLHSHQKNDIIFSNRRTTAANFLYYGSTDVAFSQYGEYWRQAKKICVLKLLSLKRVQSFQYVRKKKLKYQSKRYLTLLKGASINLSEI
ncbi:cytochrome p450 71a1 [Quercus suber]|uniref:Cytochrome p450 71a1 n=1 Tax=Quercus suber TaxID=58331 RepID=A0AAW0LJY0_QUESU